MAHIWSYWFCRARMGPKNHTRVAFFMLSLARLRCHSKSSSSVNSVVISPVLPPALDGVTWYQTYQILLSYPPHENHHHHYHHQGAPVVAFHIMKGGWTTVTTLYTVFARKLQRKMRMILNILLCAIKLRRGRKKKPTVAIKLKSS